MTSASYRNDGRMTRFIFRLSEDRDEALSALAKREGISKADVVRLALNEILDRNSVPAAHRNEHITA